ncbi:DUF3014 domain-containing protein [Pyxidicoccus parkwayensis]|uniref:DUF3014 domain-containing protein n=1 Tax=Pyxidicoccus parkwayensis TaxID=2813578 RepID=A0ABX7P6U1_9BACT|nr:DUF3014 domain-containing protein [Pyxidicoccus parkwaysis]QSQ26194.1 DUF3014 domain-containing protein [Pyxidicoccus parkwaysis]
MTEPMSPTPAGASQTPPSEPPRGSRAKTLAVVLLLVGLGVAASYYGLRRQIQAPEVATTPVVDAGVAAPPVEEASLPESDGRVRALLARLSGEPEFAKWLQEKDLVRRFTAAVNNIAEGASPRMVLGFLAPAGGFEVTGSGDKTAIDPKSYARYDTVARVFGSLDAQAAGSAYRELKSLIDQAHREIAPPNQPFDRTFSQAIQHLLAVPVPDGAVQVQPKGALYAFASPELEGLSPAQKHLLRMGPENMRTIQAKLRELQSALGLPPVAER